MEDFERRKLKKWTVLMCILLVLVVLVSLRLTNITVKGNSRYTAEEVEEMVFPDFWDKNTVFCLVKEFFGSHEDLPFVQDYDIQLTGPFSCDLVIYEKSIVGYVRYMSSNMYFDKDGVIVESSQETLPGIPEVTGLNFGHIILNRPLPVEEEGLFNEIMNITQQLNYYGIPCDRIHFDQSRNVSLYLEGGNIIAEMGPSREIDTRISVLNDMLPALSGKKGTLDLTDYNESDREHVTSFRLRDDQETE